MASVSGISSSSSSIYGNRNVLTGLASGLDTESMIENAISAYKNKIITLTQKRTKTEWKQEAYRSIIDKMAAFTDKYTSYRSASNLMSSSFFDQAVKTTSQGKYADKVSATGRSSSDIQVNRVKQLATAATYRVSGSFMDGQSAGITSKPEVAASETFDLAGERAVGLLSGTMTLSYGAGNSGGKLYIDFDQEKVFNKPQDLVDEINKQLKEQTVTIGSKSYTGQELLEEVVQAKLDGDGNITFTDPKQNNVYISSASTSIRDYLLGVNELSSESGKQLKSFNASQVKYLQTTEKNIDYLTEGTLTVKLDGVSKSVKLPSMDEIISKMKQQDTDGKVTDSLIEAVRNGWTPATSSEAQLRDDAFAAVLQDHINKEFGEGKLEVKDVAVDNAKEGAKRGLQLQFSAAEGSSFTVNSTKAKALGFGETENVTSYLNTNRTLEDLLKSKGIALDNSFAAKDEMGRVIRENTIKDADGNITGYSGDILYSFQVNGKEIGQFKKDTTLSTILNTMSNNSDSEVKASYSKTTNELVFTAKNTGENSKIEMSGLSAALFGTPNSYDGPAKGTSYEKGQDAIFSVSINGTELDEIKRSSNSVEFDGMTLNLKGTFGYETNADGSIKKAPKTDANGNAVLSYDGGNLYGKQAGDSLKIVNAAGKAYQYKTGDQTDPLYGKEVYGRVGDDGKLSFYVKNGDEETQVYAAQGSSDVWFSADKNKAKDVTAEMTDKGIKTDTEAVTFKTASDADKIVDAVKAMVEDYNAMVTEIKNAYSTLPLQRSNGAYYEPLTDEDQDDMSESAINAWQEKAKTGVLFGDRDLSALYNRLTSAISINGEFGSALRAAGITVNYSNGLSTLDFNESEFRAALESDPDKVRDAFVSSTENGAKSNGLMQALKQPLDMYAKTTGGKGILVNKAGSSLAATSLYSNTIQKELDDIDSQIEKWQDKMSNQVDRYTSQFTRLEQLIQQMNSQSSYFSQLMGG